MGLAAGGVIAERYLLERRVGSGGMGVVWRAQHLVTRKPVALKFLRSEQAEDKRTRHRFVREARAASAVRHPNVVEIHDVIQLDDGTPVMVMEFLEGESLGERLERETKLSLANVARLMLPVVSAVGTAHSAGIVHRDLKPDNIFLSRGDPERRLVVKVLDFGIAKLTAMEGDAASTAALTGTGAMLGTPYYMAPEQVFGDRDIDHRADVWSLGVILYECLTGKRPVDGDNIGQIMKAITHGNIEPIERVSPDLSEDVSTLIGAMLSVDKTKRPESLHAIRDVLQKHADLRRSMDSELLLSFDLPIAPVSRASLPDIPRVEVAETLDAPPTSPGATLSPKTSTAPPPLEEPKKKSFLGIGLAVSFAALVVAIAGWQMTRSTPTVATSHELHPEPSAVVTGGPQPTASIAITLPSASTGALAVPTSAKPSAVPAHTTKPAASTSPSATPSAGSANSFGGLVDKPPF